MVFKACSSLGDLEACVSSETRKQANQIHALAQESGLDADPDVGSAFDSMFSRCGHSVAARELSKNFTPPAATDVDAILEVHDST